MRPCLPFLLLLPLLAACNNVVPLGMIAIEQRKAMNDLQARATLAASCDISLGAYYRALSESERRYVALACGADGARQPAAPPPEPPAPVAATPAPSRAAIEPAPKAAPPEEPSTPSARKAPLVQGFAPLPPPSGRDLLMSLDPRY
ncbi:MAG: hypothetical protein KDG89_06345 [Geminicoccaceae bacterium]|nr:hypothetical protein [Geminicoccaceae bacterium]